jgi:hypothetical protein
MKAVASEPDLATKSPEEIMRDLAFKGSFQYVDDKTFSPQNVHIKNGPGGGTMQVKYDKDIPFMYNIDFLLHFEKTVPLGGGTLQVKYNKDIPFLYNVDFLLRFEKTVTLGGPTDA